MLTLSFNQLFEIAHVIRSSCDVKKMAMWEYLSLQCLLIFVALTFVIGILSVGSYYTHACKLKTDIL